MQHSKDTMDTQDRQLTEELEKYKHLLETGCKSRDGEVDGLISGLEQLRAEWTLILEEISERRDEYAALIQEMRALKKELFGK